MALTFISAVSSNEEESVLNAVQLLWVNLIMDTFAALALATDSPGPTILDRPPDRKSAPLITVRMYKMIFGQAICQLGITLVLHFAGASVLGYDRSNEYQLKSLNTLIFNTFVWLQIFNELNNRRLDNRLNIFEGITKNWFFLAINCIMIGGQVLIIFVGSDAFKIHPLNGREWGLSIGLGAISVPWGALIRKFPDAWVAALIPNLQISILMPRHKKRKQKSEGGDIESATPVAGRDPSAKRTRAKVTDSTNGEVEFETPLRTLSILRGERARKHIRRGFREYMHDQKTKVKEKTKEVVY